MPKSLSEKDKKNLELIGSVTDEGAFGLIKPISDLEDKVDTEIASIKKEVGTSIAEVNKKASQAILEASRVAKMEGKPGKPGDKGDSYVLTDSDKKEIAKSIPVPIVEKVIEKHTETIIKEQPIITEKEIQIPIPLHTSPQEVRDLLELLKEDERLDAKAIKGLEEYIKANPAPQQPMLHPTSIGNLPDVNVVGVTVDQVLAWNGTYWYPKTISSISAPDSSLIYIDPTTHLPTGTYNATLDSSGNQYLAGKSAIGGTGFNSVYSVTGKGLSNSGTYEHTNDTLMWLKGIDTSGSTGYGSTPQNVMIIANNAGQYGQGIYPVWHMFAGDGSGTAGQLWLMEFWDIDTGSKTAIYQVFNDTDPTGGPAHGLSFYSFTGTSINRATWIHTDNGRSSSNYFSTDPGSGNFEWWSGGVSVAYMDGSGNLKTNSITIGGTDSLGTFSENGSGGYFHLDVAGQGADVGNGGWYFTGERNQVSAFWSSDPGGSVVFQLGNSSSGAYGYFGVDPSGNSIFYPGSGSYAYLGGFSAFADTSGNITAVSYNFGNGVSMATDGDQNLILTAPGRISTNGSIIGDTNWYIEPSGNIVASGNGTFASIKKSGGTSSQFLKADGSVDSSTYATASSTTTFTNKRITKRVGSTTSSATPTINTDNYDVYKLTAQAANITSFTTNLSGTPTDQQVLNIAITGTGTYNITWGSSFENGVLSLPTTGAITTTLTTYTFVYNGVTSKWRYAGNY